VDPADWCLVGQGIRLPPIAGMTAYGLLAGKNAAASKRLLQMLFAQPIFIHYISKTLTSII